MKAAALLLVTAVTIPGCEPEPTSYEDCILQKIDDVPGESAKLLAHACEKKFPQQ